jgi:tetratricopeptide (TPR) repeat protein
MGFWLLGSVLRRRADFEAGAESYELAVALDPRSSSYLTQLGIAYQYLRRNEKAVDTFDRAIAPAKDARRVVVRGCEQLSPVESKRS